MQKFTYTVFVMILGVIIFVMCEKEKADSNRVVPLTALSPEEKEDLLILREEEKLARDVYLYAYEKYGMPLSGNTAQSEQLHMDKVLAILIVYGVEDPTSADTGVFFNAGLQSLYDDLIAQTDISEKEAVVVGAMIEDLDIKDIEHFKSRTNKADIMQMYNCLVCGSRNHLRSYYGQISAKDTSYAPQFISQKMFDDIVGSTIEQCCLE